MHPRRCIVPWRSTVKESVMRILRCLAVAALLGTAGLAAAEGGLRVDAVGGFWSVQQTRLQINAVVVDSTPSLMGLQAPLAGSLGGDLYFSKALADPGLPRTGFRASSVLLFRQPGVSLSDLAWSSRSAASFATPSRPPLGHGAMLPYDSSGQSVSALPYLGIGYSDYSLKTGWGFWADIGLVVQQPGNALRMGSVLSGTQSMEDLLRDLRMSPMLQLGVNYSF
jgi:hypothetical protein